MKANVYAVDIIHNLEMSIKMLKKEETNPNRETYDEAKGELVELHEVYDRQTDLAHDAQNVVTLCNNIDIEITFADALTILKMTDEVV